MSLQKQLFPDILRQAGFKDGKICYRVINQFFVNVSMGASTGLPPDFKIYANLLKR